MLKTLDKPANGNGKKSHRPEIAVEVVTITPDIARAWLEKNKKNRKQARLHKQQFVRDMKSGNWRLTGDMIRFDINGDLIDGQHRLQACVDAEVNFKTFVAYGLQPDDQDVIDTGRVRSGSDALAMNGFAGTTLLAAFARNLVAMKADAPLSTTKLSNSEILQVVRDRPTLIKSVGMVWALPPRIPRVPIGLVHWIATNKLKAGDVADQFVEVFKTGEPAYKGCPAHRLRERFLVGKTGDRRSDIQRNEQLRSTIHAWNLFATNERLERFAVPKTAHIVGLKVNQL